MSKGWESKNVEEQQAQAASAKPTPAQGDAAARAATADRERRMQALQLQREQVLSERTSNPHRRSALAAALESIEYELEQLGSLIKL